MAGAEETATETTNLDAQAPDTGEPSADGTGLLGDDGAEAGEPGVAVGAVESLAEIAGSVEQLGVAYDERCKSLESRLEYVEGVVDKLADETGGGVSERFDRIEAEVSRLRAFLQGPGTIPAAAVPDDAAADEAMGPVIMRVRSEDQQGHRRGGIRFTREWRFVREGEVTDAQAKAIMDDTRLECELVG